MTTVIKGARLVDGTGRTPLDRAVVVIEGKRIKAVGREGEVAVPADGAKVIDAAGRTVLPGLMDLHTGFIKYTYTEQPYGNSEKNIAASTLRGVPSCRMFLEAGITTVRNDCCSHHGAFAMKEAIASGIVQGPRMITPGRGIAMTGGHGWNHSIVEADGPDAVRKAARVELKAGADWIKLMASGGAGSSTERVDDVQFTVEELRAGVEEAHKKGKYAFAHVSCAGAARNCIAAGMDSIEHGMLLEQDVVDAMADKGIFLVPTLSVYHRLVGQKGNVPDYLVEKAKAIVEAHGRSFQMAMKAGVKIATGTDSGGYWFPVGESLLWEMELMNGLGMSAMETVISATRRAAECLRMDGDIGTLEPGKFADILIVDGDPLANMSAIRNTWLVMKEGQTVFSKVASDR